MNRQRLPYHGGTDRSNYINIVGCVLIFSYNLIDLIRYSDPFLSYLLYLTPFIVYPIVYYFIKDRLVTVCLYVLVGFLTIMLNPDANSLSGTVYMFFAYNEIKKTESFIAIISLSLIALSLRFIIINALGSEAVISILLFTFIFTTFYFKVVKQPKQIKNIDLLKEEEKAIVKLYCNGYSYENISKTLSLNILPSTLRRKITAIKDLNGINNDAQFGKWLYELV